MNRFASTNWLVGKVPTATHRRSSLMTFGPEATDGPWEDCIHSVQNALTVPLRNKGRKHGVQIAGGSLAVLKDCKRWGGF